MNNLFVKPYYIRDLKSIILKIKNYQKTVAIYITIKYNNVIKLLYKKGGNENND